MVDEDLLSLTDREKAKSNDFQVKRSVRKFQKQFSEAGYKIDQSHLDFPVSEIHFENRKKGDVDGIIKVYHYCDTDNHRVEASLYDDKGKKTDFDSVSFHRNSKLTLEKLSPLIKQFLEKLISRNPPTSNVDCDQDDDYGVK